ncbi:unnamed protein product [Schistosoma margrebowiei]|uniref:Uncharacterized protein n=1 Tax=Schistosoma margrebowiei TaxID=48269 RepID=A0A183MKD0_9TREM|nr:unnamed protein product [Schistosoma margrebowiei]
MVIEGSQQETLDLGFVPLGSRQQGVPVIMRGLMLPDGFDPVSPSFTVRDVNTEVQYTTIINKYLSTYQLEMNIVVKI